MNAASAALSVDTAGQSVSRFIDNSDGTVTDVRTGLMWSKATLTSKCVNHDKAIKTCADLDLAGHKDWRLPNPHELQSLVDYGRCDPPIDTDAFPGTKSDWYWTGTVHAAHPDCAWFVSFSSGVVNVGHRDGSNAFVRAVRSVSPRQ